MFNVNMNQEEPRKALENARNAVNKGAAGRISKVFMGQAFADKMNSAMDRGQAALVGVNQMGWVARHGVEASAEVLSVADMGTMINMNLVVEMKLTVTPAAGAAFETIARTMVSRIAVPRKGDKIRIKYNPIDIRQIFVMP